MIAAGGLQAAIGSVFISNGEIAEVGLLHTGISAAALYGICPVQLDDHIARARGPDGGAAS